MDDKRLNALQLLACHQEIIARLKDDPKPVLAIARDTLARWEEQCSSGNIPKAYRVWDKLLMEPVETIIRVIGAEDERGAALRLTSPLMEALTPQERWRIGDRMKEELDEAD